MGFTLEDKGKIRRYLGVDFSRQNEINDLCDQVESFSESGGVQITLDILCDLDSITKERLNAAKGITRVDVIEFKPERNCDLSRYKRQLVSELAKSIGFDLTANMGTAGTGLSMFDQGNFDSTRMIATRLLGGSC